MILKWILIPLIIFGFVLSHYFLFKAMQNLSEKGKQHYRFILFFFTWVSSDHFTPTGQYFRRLSLISGVTMLILFVWLGISLMSKS